jgi:hypothetical protein
MEESNGHNTKGLDNRFHRRGLADEWRKHKR